MNTELAVRAKMTGRLPTGHNWNDVNRAVRLAARRFRSLSHEQRKRLREGGA